MSKLVRHIIVFVSCAILFYCVFNLVVNNTQAKESIRCQMLWSEPPQYRCESKDMICTHFLETGQMECIVK